MTANTQSRLYAIPRDKSLQAYKDWISGFYTFLTGTPVPEDDRTEEKWIEDHRRFWAKMAESEKVNGETNA